MTLADEARAKSIQCEMVKYAYRQTKDGVVVSFVVHPNDIPAALSTSHIGSRYVAVLVQIGDDEKPIPLKPAKEPPTKSAAKLQPDTSDKTRPAGVGREKRDWRELPVSQQAGIRINEPTFAAYLREEHSPEWRETGDADACIKLMLGVNSKRDIANNHKALVLWRTVDVLYQAWLAKERIGA